MSSFKPSETLVIACLLLLASVTSSLLVSRVHAATGLVCIADPSVDPGSCPSSPVNFTAAGATDFTVAVNIQDSTRFNGFDITVKTDPRVLQPIDIDLSGTIFPPANIIVLRNSVDSNLGLARVAIVALGFFTPDPATGHLFSILYQVAGPGRSPIFFPPDCPNSSSDSFCVTIANPELPGSLVPVDLQTGSFGGPGDFGILADPSSQNITEGSSANSTITLVSLGGFSGLVELSTTPLVICPTCPNWSVEPQTVFLDANGTVPSTLTFTAMPDTPPGEWVVTVFGISGSTAHSVDVSFLVVVPPSPDFTVSVSSGRLTIGPGRSATSTVSLTSLNGFEGQVVLSASVRLLSIDGEVKRVPAVTLDPSSLTLPRGGTASATLLVSTRSAILGIYIVTITAVGGSVSHTVLVVVTVLPKQL